VVRLSGSATSRVSFCVRGLRVRRALVLRWLAHRALGPILFALNLRRPSGAVQAWACVERKVKGSMMLKPCSRAITFFVLILVTVSTAQTTGSAVDQFQSLQAELRASHKANDWHSNLVSASKLKGFLHEAPDSLLEVARAEVHVGNLNAALHEIEQFVRMGQPTDLLVTSPDFAALVKDVSFTKLQSGMTANRVAISLGSTGFCCRTPASWSRMWTMIRVLSGSSSPACGKRKSFRPSLVEPVLILQKRRTIGPWWLLRLIPHVVCFGQPRLRCETLASPPKRIWASRRCFAMT
jgi:hypothetical protein